MKKDAVVLVTSGRKEYREDELDSIARRFDIHLVERTQPTWQLEYVQSHNVVPDFTAPSLVSLVQRLPIHYRSAGVMCWDEASILGATLLAEMLNVPSPTVAAVTLCRDKYLLRHRLDEYAVPQPRYAIVSDIDSAIRRAREIGYPVVVKPRSASASLGVALVSDDRELMERFDFARTASISGAPQHQDPVLIEKYVSGPTISIDSLVEDGVATPYVIARKSVGYAPYFEEIGHEVCAEDPLLDDEEILHVVNEVHRALTFGRGWTHLELALTSNGPAVIEVNARIGGDLISRLAYLVHGVELANVACNAAKGIQQGTADRRANGRRQVAASRFLYARRDGVEVQAIGFDTSALPAEIDRAVALARPGDLLRLPPEGIFSGRAAVVVAAGDDRHVVQRALDSAEQAFRLKVTASA